jgi:glucose-1-phosphate thymidylyltransferase
VLGDNIIEGNIRRAAAAFEKQEKGARILLKEVPDPQRFGVVALEDPARPPGANNRITAVREKPDDPPSNLAVIGIYMYDAKVFEIIGGLTPSARNELEITDVNNAYLADGTLEYDVLEGWWSDAGTFESLHRVANRIVETGANKTGG